LAPRKKKKDRERGRAKAGWTRGWLCMVRIVLTPKEKKAGASRRGFGNQGKNELRRRGTPSHEQRKRPSWTGREASLYLGKKEARDELRGREE